MDDSYPERLYSRDLAAFLQLNTELSFHLPVFPAAAPVPISLSQFALTHLRERQPAVGAAQQASIFHQDGKV